MHIAGIAYGDPSASVPPSWVAARMAMVAAGGGVAVARDATTGEAVGSGLYPVP